MPELTWREAISSVLQGRSEPMHYNDITDAIIEQGLKTDVGATPAASVSAAITVSLKNEGDSSPFRRASKGLYSLSSSPPPPVPPDEELGETGLINAFGMYWTRSNVLWASTPRILGRQPRSSTPVDFCAQRGVYMLHDGRAVVYVGRATDQLGIRLRQHTVDRLNGRWDRFSWFGVYPASESGKLNTDAKGIYNLDMLIFTMEALLIEGLEPPQNRKKGDDFKAVEFLQHVEVPDIKDQVIQLMKKL
jgi:hypothetical protein